MHGLKQHYPYNLIHCDKILFQRVIRCTFLPSYWVVFFLKTKGYFSIYSSFTPHSEQKVKWNECYKTATLPPFTSHAFVFVFLGNCLIHVLSFPPPSSPLHTMYLAIFLTCFSLTFNSSYTRSHLYSPFQHNAVFYPSPLLSSPHGVGWRKERIEGWRMERGSEGGQQQSPQGYKPPGGRGLEK